MGSRGASKALALSAAGSASRSTPRARPSASPAPRAARAAGRCPSRTNAGAPHARAPQCPGRDSEPARPFGQRFLRPPRLPFRHLGFGALILGAPRGERCRLPRARRGSRSSAPSAARRPHRPSRRAARRRAEQELARAEQRRGGARVARVVGERERGGVRADQPDARHHEEQGGEQDPDGRVGEHGREQQRRTCGAHRHARREQLRRAHARPISRRLANDAPRMPSPLTANTSEYACSLRPWTGLQHERRARDVGEHRRHHQPAAQGEGDEAAVAQQPGEVGVRLRPGRSDSGSVSAAASSSATPTTASTTNTPCQVVNASTCAPEHRGEDRRDAADEHQGREQPRRLVAAVEVAHHRAADDDPRGAAEPLQERAGGPARRSSARTRTPATPPRTAPRRTGPARAGRPGR